MAVRNVWRATDRQNQRQIEFGGIVIWRIDGGKLADRWAYLESPHPVRRGADLRLRGSPSIGIRPIRSHELWMRLQLRLWPGAGRQTRFLCWHFFSRP